MSAHVKILLLALAIAANASDNQPLEESEAAKKERLYQQSLTEFRSGISELERNLPEAMRDSGVTNIANSARGESMFRELFEANWIHSSFGLRWDEVPPPTLHGTNSTEGVRAFVAGHGWQMNTNELAFVLWDARKRGIPFIGLPWQAIQHREFRAVTDQGILYVPLRYGPIFEGLACSGVAYNPRTNRFPATLRGFKHIGDHWYVWRQGDPPPGPYDYEGSHKPGQQDGPANRSQPVGSGINRPPAAAGSSR